MTDASQMSIFDTPPPRFPRTHRKDPSSSHRAAAVGESTGLFKRQAEQVLKALRERPGATSAELAHYAGMDLYAVRRRLTELADADCGLVRQIKPEEGTTPCAIAHKRVCRWEPT